MENKKEKMDTNSIKSNESSATSRVSHDKGNSISCEVHELLAEAKRGAKLVKSKVLRKGSEYGLEAVNDLFSFIAGLTSQLAFVKRNLRFVKN